jgi:hypothetical protein
LNKTLFIAENSSSWNNGAMHKAKLKKAVVGTMLVALAGAESAEAVRPESTELISIRKESVEDVFLRERQEHLREDLYRLFNIGKFKYISAVTTMSSIVSTVSR